MSYKRHVLTDEDREQLDGVEVVASVSGGKDSAALSLWLKEHGIQHRRVFADTGWEHPATYEYLRGPLTEALGPIDEVSGPRQMVELVLSKGMFPSRLRRFCTSDLKVKPLIGYHRKLDADTVSAVGIRAAESKARANMPRWEDSPEWTVWRPLIAWTEADVIAIHQEHGLAPNPLYLRGAERVGCWPCIFSRKREIALVAEMTPSRIGDIAGLEEALGAEAEARTAKDGKPRTRPTFFHRGSLGDGFVPIQRVVEWARTDRGGRQVLLLDKEPAGCVRWGLCDAHGDGDGDGDGEG